MAQDVTTTSSADEPAWTPVVLRISDALRTFVDIVGRWGSWLFLPMIFITMFDVVARKAVIRGEAGELLFSIQVLMVDTFGRIFESTLLQEMEWHFHTGLFALVLGYGYIYNTHVRVDLVRETLAFRNKAWLEFLGVTFFLIPFLATLIWFAFGYVETSYTLNEISASQVGLSHRWIIKSVLMAGLVVALIAGIAVWLQIVIVLWGPADKRFPLMTIEWPEEEAKLEGKERLVLAEEVVKVMEETKGGAQTAGASTR